MKDPANKVRKPQRLKKIMTPGAMYILLVESSQQERVQMRRRRIIVNRHRFINR